MGIKVTLRQKKLKDGRYSLFLDYYPAIECPKKGTPTRRGFLGLYIFDKPKNPIDKQHNKETLQLAEQIRQKKHNELNKPEIYTGHEKEQLRLKAKGEKDFVEYFLASAKKRVTSNYQNWLSAYKHLQQFTGGCLTFAKLNEGVLNEFREYLLNAKSNKSDKAVLSRNSAVSYFNKVKAVLKQAYKEGYLPNDLCAKVDAIKPEETRRNYLALEELNALVKTECINPVLKNAALFSALTGLRFSDIENLQWQDVEHQNGQGYTIRYRQQKTKAEETHPISAQAYTLMGEKREATDKVFEGLQYSAYQNKHLRQWIKDAGITKPITFHCFRHTYATLQLSGGTDIYTISKLLGHKNVQTTQIYTKVVNEAKRKAADSIQIDM